MWVTQTYLGKPDPKAELFVYYVYEEYSPPQAQFTKAVNEHLGNLGQTYREKVSLFVPDPKSRSLIAGEMREIRPLWDAMHGKLPGILIARRPLSEFDPEEEFYLIPFKAVTPRDAAEVVDQVHRTLHDQLSNNRLMQRKQSTKVPNAWWERFYDALELKPGYCGVRIDLKKLLRPANKKND
ncbi:hypothetical protein [Burkholderia gladioli]|uniref:hypothetical protein n=1 Tax=Burkholderia gladioli TaxID=28095 RepID=UPI0011B2081C|nr:hypothetical protein [Burkholderia gladioli]MBU9188146.1 hypothetical protein [Burkholderia gladioli]